MVAGGARGKADCGDWSRVAQSGKEREEMANFLKKCNASRSHGESHCACLNPL